MENAFHNEFEKDRFGKNGIITSTTLKKIRCGDPVSLNVLGKICVGLGVGPEAVVEFKTLDGTVKSL